MVWLGRPCPVSGDVPVTQDFFYIINATQDHSILYVFRQIHQNQHNWYWWRRRWRWWWWLQQQVEVVRALDSRCQVRQVALGHGRMPPSLYWCHISWFAPSWLATISPAPHMPPLYIYWSHISWFWYAASLYWMSPNRLAEPSLNRKVSPGIPCLLIWPLLREGFSIDAAT